MILNFERVVVGTEPVMIGGRGQDGNKRDDVGIVDRNEFVRIFGLPQVLVLVDNDIHGASSRFFVQFLMKLRG